MRSDTVGVRLLAGATTRGSMPGTLEEVQSPPRIEYTCALDVLDENPEGIGPNRVARLLGMAKQSADYLTVEGGRPA
jgi:hypothetical protein